MSSLKGKNILIGISAGIAAYKIPLVVRLLKKRGAGVKVLMTPDAQQFVTPLTLATLSQNEVYIHFTELLVRVPMERSCSFRKMGRLFLIAPATSNTLSAMVHAKVTTLNCDLSVAMSRICGARYGP